MCWSGPAEEFLSFARTCGETSVKTQPQLGELFLPGADPGHVRSVAAHAGTAGGRLQTGGGGVGVDLGQREVAQTLVPAWSRWTRLGVASLAFLLQTLGGSDAGAGESRFVGLLEIRKYEKEDNF